MNPQGDENSQAQSALTKYFFLRHKKWSETSPKFYERKSESS